MSIAIFVLIISFLPLMLFLKKLFIALLFLHAFNAAAQTNISKLWADADPAKKGPAISAAEKLTIHQAYLKEAIAKGNLTQQFYGNLYLYTYYMDEQNYTAAIPFLLSAENMASQKDNISWQAFVKLRTGWVAFIVQHDVKKAIKEFETGAKLSALAKDSLCMARCFEQLSAMYSGEKQFEKSQYYFDQAIPIFKRFANSGLDAAYSNFSGLRINEGRSQEALLYIDSAIQIVKKEKNERRQNFYLINRAVVLQSMQLYDSAEAILTRTMQADEKNKWMDNLLYDYEGLKDVYHAKGNFSAAYNYLDKYHALKDSLSGVAVNLKVAGISTAHKTELDNLSAKDTLQKRNWIIAFAAFLLLVGLLFWRMQYTRAKKEQLKNRDSLTELTRILIEKNTQLTALETQLNKLNNTSGGKETTAAETILSEDELTADEQPMFENDLYNLRVLTADDWAAFKIYFDKAYPGYLRRLRMVHPQLSEAEERLFLFIKLNLKNREAAAILGISADSVKKTRARLRRRLEFEEQMDLEKYVEAF